jgi:hypothetical protein
VNRVPAASTAIKKARRSIKSEPRKSLKRMSVLEHDRQTVNDPIVSRTRVRSCALKPRRASPYADPAMVFLARASACDRLVASGDMTLDEAIDGLILAFERLHPCACGREIFERMMGPAPRKKQRAL